MGLSFGQLLVILLIVVLLFGTKKLKNIGSDLGGAMKGFKDAVKNDDKEALENHKDEKVIEGEAVKEKKHAE